MVLEKSLNIVRGAMEDAASSKSGWKQKLSREMAEYLANFVYMALLFGVFTLYRRLILDEYRIGYFHYGAAVIEALVLAKLIMIGDMLRLGRRLEDRPLIVPALYSSAVFIVWVAAFSVVERVVEGLLHGKGIAGGIDELLSKGIYELAAKCLTVFFAFIPFFAFRELERVLGERKLRRLLFRGRPAVEEDPASMK